MKKISILLLLAALSIGTSSIAIQTINIDEQKAINQATSEQYQQLTTSEATKTIMQIEELANRYMNNLRNCEPLHFNTSIDIFGFKMVFNTDINGWNDNKCTYSMSGKIASLGKDLREVYNINFSDEKLSQIEPTLKCDFTKEQLNIFIDGVIASAKRQESEVTKTTGKTTAEKYDSLSPEEKKAVDMFVNENICTVPNMMEIIQKYSELTPAPEM